MKTRICAVASIFLALFVASTGVHASFVTPPPPILSVTGTLSSAQILALSVTPVTVIPAQGAGTAIIVDAHMSELVFNSTPYSGAGTFTYKYNGSVSINTGCASTFFTVSVNEACFGSTNVSQTFASSFIVNVPIQATDSLAETLGNSPVNYWIRYHVLTGL